MSSRITEEYGYTGGIEFPPRPVRSIGFRAGNVVDQIRINNETHGGSGGTDRGTIEFGSEEYITEFWVNCGVRVDYVKLRTNKGRILEAGGQGGDKKIHKSGVRVLEIGGRAGVILDSIRIRYIEEYQPSVIVDSNIRAIVSFFSPGTTIEEYTESSSRLLKSFEHTVEFGAKTSASQTVELSASAESVLTAKASRTTGIEFSFADRKTFKEEIEENLVHSKTTTIAIQNGHVGIMIVNGDLMQTKEDKEELYWLLPNTAMSHVMIPLDAIDQIRGSYDLTGTLYTQMSGLEDYKTTKNGYTYYTKKG